MHKFLPTRLFNMSILSIFGVFMFFFTFSTKSSLSHIAYTLQPYVSSFFETKCCLVNRHLQLRGSSITFLLSIHFFEQHSYFHQVHQKLFAKSRLYLYNFFHSLIKLFNFIKCQEGSGDGQEVAPHPSFFLNYLKIVLAMLSTYFQFKQRLIENI